MVHIENEVYAQNKELFDAAEEIHELAILILSEFNSIKFKLADLTPHKRIFLFFFTRTLKTYTAIHILCKEGYGQDVATLLRSLLDNLISIKYILYEPRSADEKTVRFVDYKWVIMKRHLFQEEKDAAAHMDSELFSKKSLIMEKFEEYKQKYHITSDRGLLTWSGKTVKDMAMMADKDLLKEYESVFRICSQFSHPTIIGDKEYLNYEDGIFALSPLPTVMGVVLNLKKAVMYLIDFLKMHNELFGLHYSERIKNAERQIGEVFRMEKYNKSLSLDKSFADLSKEQKRKALVQFATPATEGKT